MRFSVLRSAERILLTLWVGGLWTTGFMVAPLLFARLEERALAGSLAGECFSILSYAGIVCGSVLLLLNCLQNRQQCLRNWRAWAIALMVLLVLIGEFLIAPAIGELRSASLVDSPRFGQLHGLASVLFLATSVLGLIVIAAGPAKRQAG